MKIKKLSKKVIEKRMKAANSLYGIWANISKSVFKELMKKSY